MKNRFPKLVSLMLALVLLMSVCASAGAEAAATYLGHDVSKPVVLKMYLLGDKPEDFDKVYEIINEKLTERINATLDVTFLSWAEHGTKYPLLFSSGEEFDLIFTASQWAHYETIASRKGFLEITPELMQTYAPDAYADIPEAAWTQAKISGKIYMIPGNFVQYNHDISAVRGDLMAKYGFETIDNYDDYIKFLDAVAANEGIYPLGTSAYAVLPLTEENWNNVPGGPGNQYYFRYKAAVPGDYTILNYYMSEQFLTDALIAKEQADKGYWSRDALSTQETFGDGFLAGTAAVCSWNTGSLIDYIKTANENNPDWNCTLIDPYPEKLTMTTSYINNGMAVNYASKNPERALMAINVLMTDREIYDLAFYGIEGEHYTAMGEDQYVPLEASEKFGNYCNWGWRNTELNRTTYIENPTELQLLQKEWDDRFESQIGQRETNILQLFSFESSNVKNEFTTLDNIYLQYIRPIECGYVDNVEEAVADVQARLEKAGIQKVYDEMVRQVEEYVASKTAE